MSATINCKEFADYFAVPVQNKMKPAHIFEVEGQPHSIEECYLGDLEHIHHGRVGGAPASLGEDWTAHVRGWSSLRSAAAGEGSWKRDWSRELGETGEVAGSGTGRERGWGPCFIFLNCGPDRLAFCGSL